MPAFVSSFDYDVFVSYAHVDNVTLGKEATSPGWVHRLVDDLKTLLSQKLGRQEWGTIWIDHRRLTGDLPLTPEIQQAVRQSATLLVILSEGYLQSAWCRQERELFLQAAAQSGGAEGRLFIVQLTDIERRRWPEPFTDLRGYEFFIKDDRDAARTLGIAADDPNKLRYSQRLDDLSRELAKRLETLRAERATVTIPQAAAAATPALPSAAVNSDNITVFLAETTPNLEDLRDNLKRQLEQVGLRVLPGTYYNRSPPAFTAAMQQDLAECVLFVQLLGPYTTPKTADLPTGYEGLQIELAKAANKPILRWHDPNLDTKAVKEPELLHCEPVMVMAFEDFKQVVEKQARALAAQRDRPILCITGEAFALVNAKTLDQAVADDICQALERYAIGYDIIDEKTPLADLAKNDIYNALIIVYGQCEQAWVQEQLRTCRKVTLDKKQQAPVCAVYIGPPPGKEPLRTRPPKFYFFNDPHEPVFHQFLKELQGKVVAQ